jgi:hypothetical protein
VATTQINLDDASLDDASLDDASLDDASLAEAAEVLGTKTKVDTVNSALRAVVLHYDRDFDLIGEIDARFVHRWIVPRGTAD